VAGRAFQALKSVNIRMISQGASLLNLSLVVAEADLAQAVALLHNEFFEQLDPNVFD
jgi:aspartate kinase